MTLVHVLAIGFVFALILIADKEALAWMRGTRQRLDARFLRLIHILIWIGLLSLTASGIALFYPLREYLLTQPLFIIKLLVVGMLFVNGILIGRLNTIATRCAFADVPLRERIQLFVSGTISACAWSAAFVLGLLLFY